MNFPKTLFALFAIVWSTNARAEQIAIPAGKSTEFTTRGGATVRLAGGSSFADEKRSSRLLKGTALISSGKRLVRRGPEKLDAGPLDITCSGTALVAVDANGGTKITCIEGASTVRLAGRRSQFARLGPSQMLLVEGGASGLPTPVEIDLARLVRTSALITRFDPLPASASIEKQIAKQSKAMAKGELIASNVTVSGSGGTASVGGGTNDTGGSQQSSSSSGGSGGSSSSGSSSGGGGAVASSGSGGGGLAAASCAA
jgi:hypothetical protein